MKSNSKIIGRVCSVNGTEIKAESFFKLPPYIINSNEITKSPRINTFVATNIGLDKVICKILGEMESEEKSEKIYLKLSVVGVIDNITKTFDLGIRSLPFVGSEVYLLSHDELNEIYTCKEKSINLGFNIFDDLFEINASINKLYSSHIGIFGNTGSGKSYTASKILYNFDNLFNNYKNNFLIILDLTGEYTNSNLIENKILYDFKNKDDINKIPINYSILKIDLWNKILSPSDATQLPLLESAHKDAVYAYQNSKNDDIFKTVENDILLIMQYIYETCNKEIFFSFRNLFSEILKDYFACIRLYQYYGNVEMQVKNDFGNWEKSTWNIEEYKNKCKKWIKDNSSIISEKFCYDFLDLFKFYILKKVIMNNLEGSKNTFVYPLLLRVNRIFNNLNNYFLSDNSNFNDIDNLNLDINWIFKNKNRVVVNLSLEEDYMKVVVSGIVTELIYEIFKNEKYLNKSNNYVSIFIDECHELISETNYKKNKIPDMLDSYEKISKEGRKFNVFLTLVSQRPSDISQTVLSQMHNLFIHKLTNSNDIQKIKNSISYLDDDSIKMISYLGNGECIVSGQAFPQISFCKINISDLQESNKELKTSNFEFFDKEGNIKLENLEKGKNNE